MDQDYEFSYLALHITKLESPEGFHVWKREMQEYLIAVDLWKWTEEKNSEAPAAEIPDRANDGSNELARATALAALEGKVDAWKERHGLACISIVSRLGTNYLYDFRAEINAHKLWNRITKD